MPSLAQAITRDRIYRTTYSVPLDESEWVIETGAWADIISSVNSVRIMGEFVDGDEIVRLDNVILIATLSAVFVPCVFDDFNTPGTVVNMGTLLEGNVNDDTTINLFDFGILARSWPTNQGDPGFDSRADFDRNGSIDLFDLLLGAGNWLKVSPVEIP